MENTPIEGSKCSTTPLVSSATKVHSKLNSCDNSETVVAKVQEALPLPTPVCSVILDYCTPSAKEQASEALEGPTASSLPSTTVQGALCLKSSLQQVEDDNNNITTADVVPHTQTDAEKGSQNQVIGGTIYSLYKLYLSDGRNFHGNSRYVKNFWSQKF